MGDKKKKGTWGESFIFYGLIFAALFCLIAAAPMTPWRAAKVDTNVGNRFTMERYYYLQGATDQFGKTVSWFALKKKFQRKFEEFGKSSPLSAILGMAGAMVGGAGPALGCSMWTACKDHVNMRYINYMSVATLGMASMAFLGFSAMLSALTLLLMSFEDGSEKKKKKKKSDDDVLSPKGRTMTCIIFAFLFSLMGTCTFIFGLDGVLQGFKTTAYYPYAKTSAGGYAAGVGCFIQFVCVVISINRVTPMCGKKKEEDDEKGEGGWEGEEAGGYGKGGGGKGGGKGPGGWYA